MTVTFSLFYILLIPHIICSELNVVYDESTDNYSLLEGIGNDVNRVGWASFVDNITETGWSTLEIHTNPHFPDSIQAYYAGLMEGAITRNLIKDHYENTIGDYCKDKSTYCDKLKKFLEENVSYMNGKVDKKQHKCSFWYHVGLILQQAAGLEDGFLGRNNLKPHRNISVFGLYLIGISGDMEDLEVVLDKPADLKRILGVGKCSALIKVLPNYQDIYTSQVTWSDLVSMLRILKHYNLGYHVLPTKTADLIPGRSTSFSSYPGTLQSGDDFYIISSGLVTLETTIGNSNNSLYSSIKANGIVLEWIRSIVANRLATNGSSWSSLFSKFNSGTYNNQWMIVDYNMFVPGQPIPESGILTVVEQIPTLIVTADKTDVLRNQGYWPSYNVPYFKSVFDLSGNQESVDTYGDWFTYDYNPRANIFRRDQSKVTDIESMIKLMRYNNYKNDELSKCNCTPPYSAENSIAARSDLNPPDGIYPFGALGHRSHAATDAKITNYEMFKQRQFIAVAGPPHDNVPPFQWSTSDYRNSSHKGHPDLWLFQPVVQIWNTTGNF
ncbi:putative phospholipase B-like 2 [Bradysia coprophila]|uniref:putative phospholipase B-like 2 n=1 Tax=Bradysia coprophila TaxID=38358 RepID=UPI00187DC94C|nr:putative phospholipase B-like 2 [Bradysia coprophila]XP_037029409.1 putative phospholipase B-like 2 [Bradysia coprophila]XP_037029410.1 putative phospholipase B-like 2 [Bradysia coprophila]